MKKFHIVFCLIILSLFATDTPTQAEGPFKKLLKKRLEQKLGSGASLKTGNVKITLDFDGRKRYYIIHVPPGYNKSIPTPLVFVIHGGGGNPAQIEAQVDFSPLSDRDNILLVYPAGSSGAFDDVLLTWNTGYSDTYGDKQKFNDVGFLLKVLEDVSSRYNVNPRKVYSTGMSQGAFMSYRLACEASDKIAAVAPVAGSFALDQCRPSAPVSVLAFKGINDGFVTYDGKPGKHVVKPHASAVDAMSFWVQKDGLTGTTPREEQVGHAQLKIYGPGPNVAEVGLWTLTDAGHAWPGKHGERKQAEKSNMDIQATEKIWEFFKRH